MSFVIDPSTPKVCVVLVSWNGWEHTLECLESLYRGDYSNFEVVVVDNASADDSADRIADWTSGKLAASTGANTIMAQYSQPPVRKPIPLLRLSLEQATSEGSVPEDPRLVVIDAGSNLGFGGGNNLGLRYASHKSADYIWLLNNDTVVHPSAMSQMVNTAQEAQAGIVGSIVRYYSEPEKIQAFGGGYFSSVTGSARLSSSSKQRPVNFIFGASLMISKSTFDLLGGFDEKIFMYFEEVEYCIRARQKRISIAVSGAQVYHKGGMSTGDSYAKWKYIYQSRVYTMLKHFGIAPWIFFTSANWIANLLNPFADPGKRKASRNAFGMLAQSVADVLHK